MNQLSANGNLADSESSDRDFVTSIARAFSILRAFRRGERSLGNKEIAHRTGLPKSSVARLTYTLTKLGYLEYLPGEEKYGLGTGTPRGLATGSYKVELRAKRAGAVVGMTEAELTIDGQNDANPIRPASITINDR